MIDLVGLDRHCGLEGQLPTKRDGRWRQRDEVWCAAEGCRDKFESLERSEDARDLVLEVAKGYGFFSVWFTVFEGYVDVNPDYA